MDWLSGVLAIVCVAVALLHLARIALHAGAFGDVPGGPVGEISHAIMALGMAAMFSPLGDPLPAPVWTVAFVLCGAWFAAIALRTRSLGGDAAHHVVGSATMLFMLLAQHDHATVGEPAGHHGSGGGGGLGRTAVVAILLAGYFAWHALRCTDRLRTAGRPEVVAAATGEAAVAQRVRVRSLSSPRTAAVAHVVMAVAMSAMLLAMI